MKTHKTTLIMTILTLLMIMMPGLEVFAETITINGIGEVDINEDISNVEVNGKSIWTEFFVKYRELILAFTGLATLTMIMFFVLNFVKLAKSGDNPNLRGEALSGLLWTGLATSGIGSITVIIGLSYNFLN